MELYEELLRLKKEGRPSALATIVECAGSSPQKQGAKMLVRDDGTVVGTLGGGCLEAGVVQAAVMAMKDERPMTMPFELTEKQGGLVCGGKVLVYIEPVIPDPVLVILGAGHVGKALAKAARFSGFRVMICDDRPEYANRENVPDAHEISVLAFGDIFERLIVPERAYIVVATRGHIHDLEAVKASLRTKARYIGLLGSRRKKALLFRALGEAGFLQDDIDRVHIPVGLPINSVTPEEIAVSIMAQVIQKRRENAASGISRPSCSRLGEEDGTTETAPSPR
ncbi:MAG TPA: XdhC/CoxI family protein [Thermodesulfovibrionales bacterium]|nr:XdhC/CoxI family protein [Thermodesulfovibrionales bacterium]